MSENQRLEELRRRVARDPASIAFAHLAEEYRRCGRYEEAVETCRTGLGHHGAYLSARVTLARALMELGGLDEAHAELDFVLRTAPENLAALRTLSEIQRRRGDPPAAADVFAAATLAAAKDQEELEQMVRRLAHTLDAAPAPPGPAVALDGSAAETAAPGRRTAPVPDPDLFTLFGAALGAETDRLRDTAREEFFGSGQHAQEPAPSTSSRYPTLELRPASLPEPFDSRLLAELSFRDRDARPAQDPVGFAPARVDSPNGPNARETEEARKLLLILERWLAALEAPQSRV
ncbi:MAG: hypothetical protein HYZ58_12370 [Acidobacteria bacterium]|nr:hypothetical protein [Acidobacteriota bacterium]